MSENLTNQEHKLTHLDTGWGNMLEPKRENIFRIVAGNVNSPYLDTFSQPKFHKILTNATMMHINALLFQETISDFKRIQAMNILQ